MTWVTCLSTQNVSKCSFQFSLFNRHFLFKSAVLQFMVFTGKSCKTSLQRNNVQLFFFFFFFALTVDSTVFSSSGNMWIIFPIDRFTVKSIRKQKKHFLSFCRTNSPKHKESLFTVTFKKIIDYQLIFFGLPVAALEGQIDRDRPLTQTVI